ncbi:hypothetical protein GIB67_004598 [Kingdonia uniflora]|uniref:Uncharacterized protein n=1 Tax=Kingdonia uniflora TaxID=39325 RepID=A0A7J7MCZ2_9MAGN|nr:hypothetical protein GIB67_004598 [Kingdonia uniflora]
MDHLSASPNLLDTITEAHETIYSPPVLPAQTRLEEITKAASEDDKSRELLATAADLEAGENDKLPIPEGCSFFQAILLMICAIVVNISTNSSPFTRTLYVQQAQNTIFIGHEVGEDMENMNVSYLSFAIVTVVYLGVALIGAMMFGADVSSQPLDHLLPSTITPIRRALIMGVILSLAMIIVVVIAIAVPKFTVFLDFSAFLVCVSIAITLPCIFYNKIFRSQMSRAQAILNWFLFAFDTVLTVMGTMSSFGSLISG